MPYYYNDEYNIITVGEYFNNILSYQFSNTLEITDKEYFNTIQKDYFKDFYSSMIDQDIEPKWGENLLDQLVDYNSPYDYLVLDQESLLNLLEESEYQLTLMHILHHIDLDKSKKFDLLYKSIFMGSDYVFKFKRVLRDIKSYPIENSFIDELSVKLIEYKYGDLNL